MNLDSVPLSKASRLEEQNYWVKVFPTRSTFALSHRGQTKSGHPTGRCQGPLGVSAQSPRVAPPGSFLTLLRLMVLLLHFSPAAVTAL